MTVTQALETAGFWETFPPGFSDEDWESHQGYEIAFDHWSGYWVFVADPATGKTWVYNVGEYRPVQNPSETISWVRELISSALVEVPGQLSLELEVAA